MTTICPLCRLGASTRSTYASKTTAVVAPSTASDGPIPSKLMLESIESSVVFLPRFCEVPYYTDEEGAQNERDYRGKLRELQTVDDMVANLLNAWCELCGHHPNRSAKASRGRPSCSLSQMQKLCKATLAASRARKPSSSWGRSRHRPKVLKSLS